MVNYTVQIDDRRLKAKMARINANLQKAGTSTQNELAEWGKWQAKKLAPKWSGKTSDFIIARKTGTTKLPSYVVARNPTASDGHARQMADFNLVRWMHTSAKAKKHIKSGDRRFMYRTAEYMNKIKKGVAKGHFNRVTINK